MVKNLPIPYQVFIIKTQLLQITNVNLLFFDILISIFDIRTVAVFKLLWSKTDTISLYKFLTSKCYFDIHISIFGLSLFF